MKSFIASAVFLLCSSSMALTGSVKADQPIYDSVVYLSAEGVDENGVEMPGSCNATIISATHLVTAAHCVHQTIALRKNFVSLKIGRYYSITRKDGSVVQIGWKTFWDLQNVTARFWITRNLASQIQRKGVEANVRPHDDFAIIELQQPLPLDEMKIQPAVIASKDQRSRFLSARNGFQPTVVSINFFTDMGTNSRKKASLNHWSFNTSGWLESKSTSRLEPGDSGAPLTVIENGRLLILAVVKGRAETFLTNWDVYPILDERLNALVLSPRP